MKHDLSQITFVIPFFYDSPERLENLNCILKFLRTNFETNVIIVESGSIKVEDMPNGWIYTTIGTKKLFTKVDDGIFYRTKQINIGIKAAKTPFVAIYDTDVILDVESVKLAYVWR